MLNSGVDAEIEWQWDGGHVPSEVLGDSFSLYVDQMYGEYVDGAATITKAAAEAQTTNGTATEATGTDLTGWVSYENGKVSFSLADAAAYRTAGASKAMPGFDVIDYGQEDYVFGQQRAGCPPLGQRPAGDFRDLHRYAHAVVQQRRSKIKLKGKGELTPHTRIIKPDPRQP